MRLTPTRIGEDVERRTDEVAKVYEAVSAAETIGKTAELTVTGKQQAPDLEIKTNGISGLVGASGFF